MKMILVAFVSVISINGINAWADAPSEYSDTVAGDSAGEERIQTADAWGEFPQPYVFEKQVGGCGYYPKINRYCTNDSMKYVESRASCVPCIPPGMQK